MGKAVSGAFEVEGADADTFSDRFVHRFTEVRLL
jgi:hypothetical protein